MAKECLFLNFYIFKCGVPQGAVSDLHLFKLFTIYLGWYFMIFISAIQVCCARFYLIFVSDTFYDVSSKVLEHMTFFSRF